MAEACAPSATSMSRTRRRAARAPSAAFIGESHRCARVDLEGRMEGSETEPISLISCSGVLRSGVSKKKRRPFFG
jgi:hypothetical protein